MADKPTPSSPSRRVSQSRLHNFSFPTLNWGNQRLLRCMNMTTSINGETTRSTAPIASEDRRPKMRSSSSNSPPHSPIEKLRPMPPPIGDSKVEAEEEEEETSSAAARPWNLRTRRAACNAPVEIGRNRNPSSSASPLPLRSNPAKLLRLRSESSEKVERAKFSVSLAREEVKEDFLAMKGCKPPRRPKKRAKNVQRDLDSLFPGLWLSEITMDSYRVND